MCPVNEKTVEKLYMLAGVADHRVTDVCGRGGVEWSSKENKLLEGDYIVVVFDWWGTQAGTANRRLRRRRKIHTAAAAPAALFAFDIIT
jgi:hypothetical protein